MNDTIKNDRLEVSVSRLGAELRSMRSHAGVEYMWSGDPAVWNGIAPNLFPVVGMLAGDSYTFGGRRYQMRQHGFARKREFALARRTDSSLEYRISSDADSLAQYPFNFDFDIRYQLRNSKLDIVFAVANTGSGVMPFSIGAHPGFSLSRGPGDKLEDYRLEFEVPEDLDTVPLDADHLLSNKPEPVLRNSAVLQLTKNMFDRDALIFLKFKSRKVSLVSAKRSDRLTVEFAGWPNLGIWAKPGAPYVCIEPWFGHADPAGHNGDIMKKPGIMFLDPGKSFTCLHSIQIT